MDGAATLTQLVQQVLDLISEVLILALHNVSLLSDEGSSVHPLVLHGQIIQIGAHPALSLLGIGHLGGQGIHKLLTLDNLCLELVAGGLKLLDTAHALGLEAGLPELDLSLSLGQSLQGIRLPHVFILKLLPHVLEVGGHHLVLGEKSGQILVLHLQTLLGGLGLIEGPGHVIQPAVGIHNLALDQLSSFVKLRLALDSILKVQTCIPEVQLHASLVLLRLGLVGTEAIDLLTKVSHSVVVLHTKSSKSSLLGNVELLQLGLETGQLGLPLLVEVHLGGSVGASLLKTGSNVLDVLLQHGAALLSLGAVASLDSQLFVKLLKPGLNLLGLLGVLSAKGGLIINLGGKSHAFFVLARLGDHVTLLSNLILEGTDLVILVGPVLLGLH